MKRKLLSILALLCLTASSAWAGVIESGTNGNITWSLDDDGVLSISGSGEVPEEMFPYDWSNGTKVKKIIFADDCAITKLSTNMFVCYVNDSQLTDVEIKTTVPLAISNLVFYYYQDGAVNFTITAPSITSVGKHPFTNYGSPRYIVFNVPEPIPFDKGSFDDLEAGETVTIPAGCKIHTPGGYVFNDSYYQYEYKYWVEHGMEWKFWDDYGSDLVEGRDYEYSTESTEDLTSENASQVFGSATVIFASYNVTANMVNDAYWSTFYSNECNYQASEGTQVFSVNLTGDAIEMNEIADGIVKRGEGVVLKSNSASISMTPTTEAATGNWDDNSLTGTMSSITNPGNAYVLNYTATNGVGFYKLQSDGTIGANKAYLTYDGDLAREFFLFEEATGIETLDNLTISPIDNSVYDLQGRRVAQPTKGLYIVNGKKVVIK